MKNIFGKTTSVVCLMGMAGFACVSQAYSWQDIKREAVPTVSKSVTEAYLKVYTKDEEINEGGYLWQRGPRYTIFSSDGKKIKYVANENGTPNVFILSPGKYVIVPELKQYKNEITGAILEPGKMTEVHMMGG